MLILWILIILISFYVLAVVADEFFVPALDIMAERLKLSSDMAGATLMAIGSSAPELFTSLIAVLRSDGLADVGAGTIVGSAIFNILVIIGASAAFKRAQLHWQPVVRDALFYVLSIIALLVSFYDGVIVLWEALFFVSLYAGYLFAVFNWRRWFPYKDVDPIDLLEKEEKKNIWAVRSKKLLSFVIPDVTEHEDRYLAAFSISIAFIAGLSYVMVEGAVHVSTALHVPPAIIALTVLAAGTSIPDLLSSIAVAKQGRGDMAISNAVGSNIFDILIGLGGPWLLVLLWNGGSVSVSTENLLGSIFLLFATVVAVFFLLLMRNWSLSRRAGWILISLYLLYLAWNIFILL